MPWRWKSGLSRQRAVRVADAATVALGEEPLPALERLLDAPTEFFDRGRRELERDRRALDIRRIDLEQACRVGRRGSADADRLQPPSARNRSAIAARCARSASTRLMRAASRPRSASMTSSWLAMPFW